MSDLILVWSDVILDLAELLADVTTPTYIVGGSVRDAIMRRPIKDVDIATAGSGIALGRKIANRLKGDFFPLDPERDVGRALVDTPDGRMIFDVARFRGADLDADLRDRDFTINALAVDLLGDLQQVIDPLGGVRDLIDKRLRRCSPNAFSDDPIRVLRAVRQSVQFGFRIEPDTLRDARAAVPQITRTSPERVRDEFMRILSLPKPAAGLRIADGVGALAQIFPELAPLKGLPQSSPHVYDAWTHTLAVVESMNDLLAVISPTGAVDIAGQFSLGTLAVALGRYRLNLQARLEKTWADGRPHRALVLLAALLHDVGKGIVDRVPDEETGRLRYAGHEEAGAVIVEGRVADMHFSTAERDLVTAVVRHHVAPAVWMDDLSPLAIHRFWRTLGEAGIDVILLNLADYLGMVGANVNQDRWLLAIENAQRLLGAYFDDYSRYVEPPVLINGSELMRQLGLKPGPVIGELLERIRESQVSGEVLTLDDALSLARRHLDGNHRA